MNKLLHYLKTWSPDRTRPLIIAVGVCALTCITLLIIGGSLSAKTPELVTKPLPQVIEEITAKKSGIYVSTSDILIVDKESKVSAKLPAAVAETQMNQLINNGVNITSSPTLQDVFPNHQGDTLYSFMWLPAIVGSFLMALWLLAVYRKNKREAAEAQENDEARKAKAGGDGPVVIDYENPDTTFADVAGCEEAVESLHEISDFLKRPEKYTTMGVRVPKGGILSGPPGTGKSLLARALAGEAKVPFFSMAGSEFTEIYVGQGAKRVRELFKKMREHEKCILFIDEVDAVARKRSSGDSGGSNHETEATLNQLLTEIDGFNNKADGKTIIVLGATNRVDLLDPALTRSGRLERKIEVPNPDRRGREKILRLHAEGKPLASDVDLPLVAARTPGFSGADMATIINEGGLFAIRENESEITQKHLDQAIADVAMGKARKSAVVTEQDRKITAWHEAGHTVCAYLQEDHDDPVAVSIVPRGPAGGVTWMSGSDNSFMTRKQALAKLVTAFGGRAAEEHLLEGEYTQGPSGDFQQATNIAFTMVTKYGMTEVGYQTRDDRVAMSNEAVLKKVEELLEEAHKDATQLLQDNMGFMSAVVELLLEQDDVSYAELEVIAESLGVKHERTMISVPVLPEHEDNLEEAADLAEDQLTLGEAATSHL